MWTRELQPKTPSGDAEPSKAVVMVVDDEPSVLLFLVTALTGNGYTVLSAADGADALEIARGYKGRIDMVLTDVRMPGMDGTELVKRLREEDLASRVLLMTGWSSPNVPPEIRLQALRKPFGPKVLLQRVETVLAA